MQYKFCALLNLLRKPAASSLHKLLRSKEPFEKQIKGFSSYWTKY